jgi:flagellar biosynthesis/type III secretory pathway protein FliH
MPAHLHDALFKAAFDEPAAAATLLRELMPPAVRAAVVWETLRRERGSFVDKRLVGRHSDLLFSARLRTGKLKLVYFLLEHQSTSDPTMPLRILSYQSRIWERFIKKPRRSRLPPVIAVLVSHTPDGWRGAYAFEALFDPTVMAISGMGALVPRCSMIVEDLARLSNDELSARPLAAFQKLALWLLRDARDPVELLDSFEAWMPSMIEIGRTQSGLDNLEVLITYMFQVIDPMNLDALRDKLHELGSRIEKAAMTIAEYLQKKGRKEGRKEGLKKGLEKGLKKGREEGREEGRIATLRSLLVFKFRTLGTRHEARLRTASAEAIDRYLQRLLTADSLDAVFRD